MSKITHIFLGWLVLAHCAYAEQPFKYQHQFILKKDEPGLMLINRKEVTKKPTADNPNNEYLLRLRWTLFTNNMLTLLVNYRGYPTQYVLEKHNPLKNVVIPLLPDGTNRIASKTYVKIVFSDFNQSNHEAILDIFIADIQDRIEVEFRQPNKK